MDPIVLDTELNPTDWDALQRYIQHRIRQQTVKRDRVLNGMLAATPALILLYFLAHSDRRISPLAVLLGVLAVAFCLVLLARRARAASKPGPRASTWAPTRFEIDAAGLRIAREHQAGVVDWRAIESVDETENHVFLPLDRLLAYVIPKRQLVSITSEALVTQLRQWHADRRAHDVSGVAQGEPSAARPAAPRVDAAPSGVHFRGFSSGLRANLLVGVRVFFFRRVQRTEIVATFDQVAALLLVLLGVIAILDRATAGIDAEFNTFGIYTWGALLLMSIWTCALIARAVSPRADTRMLLVVVLATAPWGILTTTALSLIPAADDSAWYAYAVTAVLLWASVRAIHAAYGSLTSRALAVMAVALISFAAVSEYLYLDAHLWTAPPADDDDEGTSAPTATESEAIFFEQKTLIDHSVGQLQPQRPGVTDMYYVGFAGDGYQRVFRREALLGQRVFAERLGTGARSLELINDYQDRESFPLGTQVSLRYALSEIGKAMDPSEDVLVLLLTSHGSRDGGIAISNGVSMLGSDLPPDEVRSALDDAGIRWRIVVVSACYSGVFIEPLKTDTTMILTAADSQHTSFGCADDRDLTYFGEAFLRDSLPKAPSLAAAFLDARENIAAREKQENLTPSNPQMWVGASMAKKLGALGPLPIGAIATSTHK